MKHVFTVHVWPDEHLVSDFLEKVAEAIQILQRLDQLATDFTEYHALAMMLEKLKGTNPHGQTLQALVSLLRRPAGEMACTNGMKQSAGKLQHTVKEGIQLLNLPVALQIIYGMQDRDPKPAEAPAKTEKDEIPF